MVRRSRVHDIVEAGYKRRPIRFGSQYILDALAWFLAIALAELFRYEFNAMQIAVVPLLLLSLAAAALQYGIGFMFHLYQGRFPYGTFEEVRALSLAALVVAFLLGIPVAIFGSLLHTPRSTMFIALPIALLFMFSVRYLKRLYVERHARPGEDAERTLIYGAGYIGTSLIRRMTTDPHSTYLPVGIIDDDPAKRNRHIAGVPVRGSIDQIERIVGDTNARVLVIAVARADSDFLRRISDIGARYNLAVKVMPLLEDILAGKSRVSDLRDIAIEDIIGRHPVDTEMESIAGYLAGKRVLVTGAGGSIGSELCRQISKFKPSELIMLDRDETGLQTAQLGTKGHGLLDSDEVVLADIREADVIHRIFEARRPEVVFHAAALKHLPMLEQYPDEAWKTNVLGTLNVLNAARDAGVLTFINISTDKAANPTSVLGHSKRVAEKLTAWMADETGLRYLSVRFGNVIGSRGSMLPTFASMIEAGGPLTVTHPDVTRYFMTIPEACQLVVQAGGIGKPGEVLILDMGEPVRILDIAERMIDMSGKDITIVFTGLREGEKLHEILVGTGETDARPLHPKISHAKVGGISPERLDKTGWEERMRSQPRNNDTSHMPRISTGGHAS
ncbi:polysaccharide biosynthesis protein [Leifsonia flava]|uniref:Polysaccharide biosynthesis protein n=1 Tax=Orlajensenia leifsoniae TaxID=2561933 RepID=A0A4Y9R0R5_9MICO|nr:nucleoside-diphosphate sugar epimerase/dehydratase [Leifsonia flava]TFV96946.1 polysaccharide biosynthesis protein [Leifsonia flava]